MRSVPELAGIVRDPTWFTYRYDPGHDAFHLVRIDRALHDRATFLTDDHVSAELPKLVVTRRELMEAAPDPGPMHFVFHSAYCCSTLLTRALDVPGLAMGLKEPLVLNDIVGYSRRGGEPVRVRAVLGDALRLLARPMGGGEAIVVKPSNIVAAFGSSMLDLLPASRALLLFAPLPLYLSSIAGKGLWGRLWVRELLLGLLTDRIPPFGFNGDQLMRQTDLQIAALGWLMQHRAFLDLSRRFGPARIRMLDSETLVRRMPEVLPALGDLFGIDLAPVLPTLLQGPLLARHAKTGTPFGTADRARDQAAATLAHGDEIAKVVTWATAVAQSAHLSLEPVMPLI